MSYQTEDIVVFLPGITGSVLQKNGRDRWGTSAGAIFRVLTSRGDSIRDLALEAPDDPSLDDLGDGVTAPRLVPDTHLVPGLWKIDGYTKLTRDIRRAFRLEEGRNAHDFPYDWRRDNRVAARRLQRSVERWLHEWRKTYPKARAVLVAHSMGGLISRYYLEVLGGWENVRTLITFGTPYGGSLNALGFIENGHRPGLGFIRLDLSEVLRSFSSVYQLLPTYECVDTGDGQLRMIGDAAGMSSLDYGRARAALAFHDEIAEAVRSRPASVRPHIVPVVGIEQPTSQSARLANGVLEVLRMRDGKDESGDGTVPRVSAVPFELLDAQVEVYAAEAHGSLQNQDAVLTHLRGVLSRPDIQIRRMRPGPPIGLALHLPDAVPAGEPIRFRVEPAEGQPTLLATLSTAEGEVVSQAPLRRRREGHQEGAFDPPPEGIYRIQVAGIEEEGQRVSPVTDVFVVAPPSEAEADS
jgi:pimeloyl-ACP methyl ester carboxylesterase